MMLSIGMIVKNEEKYLRRCLTAIQPLLTQLESELIIADTGSTDQTVEIAREFTDHVFHYDWANDFAAARNFVLEKASGDWFMALDADEVFERTDDIVRFFNSGDYKKYKSASFGLKNLMDINRLEYTSMQILRFVKRTNKTRYTSPIHELIFSEAPTKILSDTAIHYGYAEDDTGKQHKKAESYRQLLLAELQKAPKSVKLLSDISNTYTVQEDYAPALDYCERALTLARTKSDPLLYALYATQALIFHKMERFDQMLQTADDYFRLKKPPMATDLELSFDQAYSAYQLKLYPRANKAFQKYIELYHQFHQGLLMSLDLLQRSVNFADEISYRDAVLYLSDSLSATGDQVSAWTWSQSVPLESWLTDERYMRSRLVQAYNLMLKRQDYSGLADIYGKLDGQNRLFFEEALDVGLRNPSARPLILRPFTDAAQTATGEPYLKLMVLRALWSVGRLNAEAVNAVVSEMAGWTAQYADMLYLTLATAAFPTIERLAQLIAPADLSELLFNSKYLHYDDLYDVVLRLKPSVDSGLSQSGLAWLSSLYLMAMLSDKPEKPQVYDLFRAYAAASAACLKMTMDKDILSPEFEVDVPAPLTLGLYFARTAALIDNQQYPDAVKQLRLIYSSSPELKKVIEIISERVQGLAQPQETELQVFARQLKQNIRLLIKAGKTADASSLLQSFEQLCPDDVDIADLKNALGDNALL